VNIIYQTIYAVKRVWLLLTQFYKYFPK